MKKYITTILVALVALAAGYAIGVKTSGCSQKSPKAKAFKFHNKADNGIGANDLILSPEQMSFTEENADNEDIRKKTSESIDIIACQLNQFCANASLAASLDEPKMKKEIKAIAKLAKDQKGYKAIVEAAFAVTLMDKGEDVDFTEAQQSMNIAIESLKKQLKAGHKFVVAADAFLEGKELAEHKQLAALRDMFVSCCSLDATICRDNAEIDFWSNIENKLQPEEIATAFLLNFDMDDEDEE